MRTNFSFCKDCSDLACAHAELNCGIDCPCCDWFVCGKCITAHSQECWEASTEECAHTEAEDGDQIYSFFKPEPTRLGDKLTLFCTPDGYVAKVIIKPGK
jgi:hypothetical protein